jgi:membrane-bound lytic murein transglycosylase MltF
MEKPHIPLPAIICLLTCLVLQPSLAVRAAPPPPENEDVLIKRVKTPFKGDLDQMRQRRMIRVLVNNSRTRFFYDHGRARGFEYELLKAYDNKINKGVKHYKKVKLIFIPVPFDRLLTALQNGKGDIAAAGLTITPDREKQVAFTTPYIPDVNEVIIHHRSVKGLDKLKNLAGRLVYIRKNSSYVNHLKQLNARFKDQKIKPLQIQEAQQYIVTEDILEMVNAGIIPITVADHHIGKAWQQVLPDIVVREDLVINSGGRIAWAVRKENPQLRAHLDQFIAGHKKGSLLGNILYNRYYLNASGVRNPGTVKDRDKLLGLLDLFKKYADRYDFDHLVVAALAYQESGLDNSKRSPTGALGIMQVLPSTAADKKVNVKDIEKLENNVHAGVKYLHFLRKRYFSDPAISPANRVYFSWAAYNAGPAKINRIRKQAAKEGFDPNKWFFHVETIAAKVIGRETVTYVANINKYYVAYQLQYDMYFKRQKEIENLRKKVGPPDGKRK